MPAKSCRDIVASDEGLGWVAVGWFTPDYRSLAQNLSDNLGRLAIPHHLYARTLTSGGWLSNCRRKPEILLTAFIAYPGKALILMDVDIEVRAGMGELAATEGDVVVYSGTKRADLVPWLPPRKRRLFISSRVMVWKPTAPALQLANAWHWECQRPGIGYGDETAFIEAYGKSQGVAVSRMDPRFAGHEKGSAPADSVIIHDSAHAKHIPWYRKQASQFRRRLRSWV